LGVGIVPGDTEVVPAAMLPGVLNKRWESGSTSNDDLQTGNDRAAGGRRPGR